MGAGWTNWCQAGSEPLLVVFRSAARENDRVDDFKTGAGVRHAGEPCRWSRTGRRPSAFTALLRPGQSLLRGLPHNRLTIGRHQSGCVVLNWSQTGALDEVELNGLFLTGREAPTRAKRERSADRRASAAEPRNGRWRAEVAALSAVEGSGDGFAYVCLRGLGVWLRAYPAGVVAVCFLKWRVRCAWS